MASLDNNPLSQSNDNSYYNKLDQEICFLHQLVASVERANNKKIHDLFTHFISTSLNHPLLNEYISFISRSPNIEIKTEIKSTSNNINVKQCTNVGIQR